MVDEPIINILYRLREESKTGLLRDISDKGTYISVTCPFHKSGYEGKPSCSVYSDYNSRDVGPGVYHCFTCGEKGNLNKFISKVLDKSIEDANDWLIDNYGKSCEVEEIEFPSWEEPVEVKKKYTYIDESILDQYMYYHPYLNYRKVDFETAKKFKVGWNRKKNSIVFPVWDEHNKLVMITERCIDNKKFYIPKGVEKPIYLLNFAIKENRKSVVVCEGQFDALVSNSYGMPAVSLFGSGTTQYQIDILKRSGINSFILMYDNDEAGRKGAERFKKMIGSDKFVVDILMPNGRDIADLSKDEFIGILKNYGISIDKL